MKSIINLKTTFLLLVFGMAVISVSAQRTTDEKDMKKTKTEVRTTDCEKVEWNSTKGIPQLTSSTSKCLIVTLVGFEKEQVERVSRASESLSNDLVKVKVSDDLKELNIQLHSDELDSDGNRIEFINCFKEIEKSL